MRDQMGEYLKSVLNNIEASKSVILESVIFGQVMLQTGKSYLPSR